MMNEQETTPFQTQVLSVCNRTHDLLGSPTHQLEGIVDTEKVVLDIPKAFTYLSGYLGMLSQKQGQPVSCWHHHEQSFARKHKEQRAIMRHYLEHILTSALHEDLHLLSTLQHSFLEQSTLYGE